MLVGQPLRTWKCGILHSNFPYPLTLICGTSFEIHAVCWLGAPTFFPFPAQISAPPFSTVREHCGKSSTPGPTLLSFPDYATRKASLCLQKISGFSLLLLFLVSVAGPVWRASLWTCFFAILLTWSQCFGDALSLLRQPGYETLLEMKKLEILILISLIPVFLTSIFWMHYMWN